MNKEDGRRFNQPLSFASSSVCPFSVTITFCCQDRRKRAISHATERETLIHEIVGSVPVARSDSGNIFSNSRPHHCCKYILTVWSYESDDSSPILASEPEPDKVRVRFLRITTLTDSFFLLRSVKLSKCVTAKTRIVMTWSFGNLFLIDTMVCF